VTKVMLLIRLSLGRMLLTCCAVSLAGGAMASPSESDATHPGEALYLRLRSVGLDASRVYRIRDASLDRSSLHITFDNGIIAFTQDVEGRITGAFFEGDGEVLLSPPSRVERSSLALFTGMAILEEQFSTAYLRFNDDTYAELRASLHSAENSREFITEWGETAQHLAEVDALRLLVTFSSYLPVAGNAKLDPPRAAPTIPLDRMLHARVQGRKLGIFDLFFDTTVPESVWAGQTRTVDGAAYYDVWTSFSPNRTQPEQNPLPVQGPRCSISGYRIRADVNPPTDLRADTRLQLEVHRGGQRMLLFELSRFLQIKQVESGGQPLEFIHNPALEGTQLARRGNDLVGVIFPQPLQDGQHLELHFTYGGEVLSEAGKGLLYVGARGTWYPNRGPAMSSFDLEFHYPPGWTLLATGKRLPVGPADSSDTLATSTTSPDQQVSRWVSERPIPMAGFNLGKYVRAVAKAGNVTVESFATTGVERNFPEPPAQTMSVPDVRRPFESPEVAAAMTPPRPSPAHNAQPVADKSARAVEFFAQRFGPFPYSSLELTQMPGEMSQGWPGLVFLSSYAFLTPAERSRLHANRVDALISSHVLVHETAHQWWGDLVFWPTYRDQWIMEALSEYSSLMMVESENPADFRAILEKYRRDLVQKNKEEQVLQDAGPVTLGARLNSSHFPGAYESISYGRGAWLFHMLRYMLRDAESLSGTRTRGSGRAAEDPFIRGLLQLREQYQGKAVTTRELLQVFEQDLPPGLRYEGKKSLSWFMDGWVNGTAVPRFEAQSVKYLQKDNSVSVSGNLIQENAPGDLVTPVPVYAVTGAKNLLLIGQVFADGHETAFRLKAPIGTRKIVLDPYQTLLTAPH
jgi:hypothetical protein